MPAAMRAFRRPGQAAVAIVRTNHESFRSLMSIGFEGNSDGCDCIDAAFAAIFPPISYHSEIWASANGNSSCVDQRIKHLIGTRRRRTI
jgi:hypothetical protein